MSSDPFLGRHPDRRHFLTAVVGVFLLHSMLVPLRRHISLLNLTVPFLGTISRFAVVPQHARSAEDGSVHCFDVRS